MTRLLAGVVMAMLLGGCEQNPNSIEALRGEARIAAIASTGPEDHRARIVAIRERAAEAGHDPDMVARLPAP